MEMGGGYVCSVCGIDSVCKENVCMYVCYVH